MAAEPVEDVIQIEDRFYILATSPRATDRTRVLKHGDTFAVFDTHGDILAIGLGEQGLYHRDTRVLSRLHLKLERQRPLLLSSRIKENNELFGADLTNPDIVVDGQLRLPRDIVHLFRSKFLWAGACYERLRLWNYGTASVVLSLAVEFDADFVDIFEVRGARRARRGTMLEPVVGRELVELGYRGLDDVVRRTRLSWDPAPAQLSESQARYEIELPPGGSSVITLTIDCLSTERAARLSYDSAFAALSAERRTARRHYGHVRSSNERFNDWVNRSVADIQMMVTDTAHGPYPYAGVPWFNTVFGRDGIITALELLWLNPGLARGVLSWLAATQASEVAPAQDAEPGKILHEARGGEMAALGEVPFGRYYGSVDATPLFLVLAGAYYSRTGDRRFIESIWSNIVRAIEWIDRFGDLDGDGFVEYARRSPTGLVQQGWKDSPDSVFHRDGTPAESPIALCEVQAYVYDAKRRIAGLAELLGESELARALVAKAAVLREAFERQFWCEELSTYALALDAHKQPCRVRTSNAGHCLFGGIASPERAQRVADTLLASDSFSGWGVRTVASSETRYNPMSYHNGSIWPHDNALIAAGFARYGFPDLLFKPLTGLFEASMFVDLRRLPELFCGFHRRAGEGPTLYPVACLPQAWAAGAAFMVLQACLGVSIDGPNRRVVISNARLPDFLQHVRLDNLMIQDGSVDLLFERHKHDVGVTVVRKQGEIEVRVIK